MSLSRRGFLASGAAGSAVYLTGCTDAPPEESTTPEPTCELPPVTEPPPLDYPAESFFKAVSTNLTTAGQGTPVLIVDMDRLDANIDTISAALAAPLSYRIVEKSLPSLDLLSYVSARAKTNKFMVLHLPFLSNLLSALPNAEVLVGKCHLTPAVQSFFQSLPVGADLSAEAARVTFLVDSTEAVSELQKLAQALNITLRIAVEIDVGLRRSGVPSPEVIGSVLSAIKDGTALTFAGLMGYDGHVAYTPGGTVDAVNQAGADATALYKTFRDTLQKYFPALANLPNLIFNSGGSSTFPLYKSDSPVNDVAAGGGVLRPAGYPDHLISALKPAIFIAAPVLRQYTKPQLPFFTEAQSADLMKDQQGIAVQGGSWPYYFSYPSDVRPAPFVNDATDHNHVPNQTLLTAPASTPIKRGDWIFFHPRQSDVIFQFQEVLQVRGGQLTNDVFAAYPRRF
ncbi:MAG: alanine racemase [Polyangiaceae bacterium]|nr:alanine racemase [Polyangiaceae bacterium]